MSNDVIRNRSFGKQDNSIEKQIWVILEQISDPELPVLSIVDLGIVREVRLQSEPILGNPALGIVITPTYSGCPAMDIIIKNIEAVLQEHGFNQVKVTTVLSPAWTTDWMTKDGKQKLKAYGIAPPVGKSITPQYLEDLEVECPQCHSKNTHLVSQFGSTACKALFKCDDCKEPFDYFKCH
jgi:ring-1,2-phenylacetyl-CoA epoxidase subunit PaaD